MKDKQNFPVVQRIAFPKVRKCLEQLDAGLQGEGFNCQEHVKGTIVHLEVIWAFLEVFYGRGSLLDRVKLSSFVVHMIYFGTKYIRHAFTPWELFEGQLVDKGVYNRLLDLMPLRSVTYDDDARFVSSLTCGSS